MIPTDQADITKSTKTTSLAGIPMLCHIVSKPQPTPPDCCCNIAKADNVKVENICFAPPFLRNDCGSYSLPFRFNFESAPGCGRLEPYPRFNIRLTAQSKDHRNG